MKTILSKIISLVILLSIVFTTFGCDSTPEATTPSDSTGLQGENIGGYIYISNIEKLNDYLKTQDIPDTFITPDMLTELGTFRAYYNKDDGDFTSYVYFFIMKIVTNCV